jgi:hypothetical protein
VSYAYSSLETATNSNKLEKEKDRFQFCFLSKRIGLYYFELGYALLLGGILLGGELRKRVELLELDAQAKEKIIRLVEEAIEEFPCLACASKDACENFKWYIKWLS